MLALIIYLRCKQKFLFSALHLESLALRHMQRILKYALSMLDELIIIVYVGSCRIYQLLRSAPSSLNMDSLMIFLKVFGNFRTNNYTVALPKLIICAVAHIFVNTLSLLRKLQVAWILTSQTYYEFLFILRLSQRAAHVSGAAASNTWLS